MRRLAHGGLVAALVALASPAARADVENQYQTWLAVNVQGRIAGPLYTQSDVQFRVFSNFSPSAAIVRPGLALRVAENMLVTLGYAWTPAWRAPDGVGFTDEHRIWEQFTYDYEHKPTGIRFQTRTRLEQRFRHPVGVEVGVRFRELLRLSVAIVAGPRPLIFVVWDEVFFSFNRAGGEPNGAGGTTSQWQSPVFDQNRVFVGLGYQVVPAYFRLELGYLNRFIRRPQNPAGDALDHVALLASFISWK